MSTHPYIIHYGIPNQKWGQRLYQYKDGSLTPLGRLRYLKNPDGNKKGESANAEKTRKGGYEGQAEAELARFPKPSNADARTHLDNRQHVNTHIDVDHSSDRELQTAISRLQLEKTYRQLIKEEQQFQADERRNNRSPLQKTVSKILQKTGEVAVNELVNGPIRRYISNILSPSGNNCNNGGNNGNNGGNNGGHRR